MTTPQDKGKSLEQSMKFLEQVIFSRNPSLRDKDFHISTNRIVIKDGVRHEIDVYIEINIGDGYKPVYIFECKNWNKNKKRVGKNDVIILSEKVEVTGATAGFLVATGFASGATAQAQKDTRIELIPVSDDIDPPNYIQTFHAIKSTVRHINATLLDTPDTPKEGRNRLDLEDSDFDVVLKDSSQALKTLVLGEATKIMDKEVKGIATQSLPAGIHEFTRSGKFDISKEELVIRDKKIECIHLDVDFELEVVHPALVSKFDIQGKGRTFEFAPVTFADGTVALSAMFAEIPMST